MRSSSRRRFIQLTTSAMAAVGFSQSELEHSAVQYARVLAQPTPRKLALLVGINNYPDPRTEILFGPTTDVELQRQLLVHRFGFNPQDILILTNENAKREDILMAYEEHLLKHAQPGDVVVFHFSGHGGRVQELDVCDESDCFNSTLVPYDFHESTDQGYVQDIMGHTRFLLDSRINTENLTVILDCCYSGGGKRGNVVMRSRRSGPSDPGLKISPLEWTYQEKWLGRLGWTPDQFIERRQAGVAKGVVITSSKRNQLSADYSFEGFDAGAFTYLLTKYLWQQTGSQSVSQVIRYVSQSTARLAEHSQNPEYEPITGDVVEEQPIFHTAHASPPGEAVVKEILGNNRVKLWLGGLDTQSLVAFNQGAVFTLLDQKTGAIKGEATQDADRDQLTTEAQVSLTSNQPVQVGDLLQERIRSIPSSLTLRVGLDPSLQNDPQALTALLEEQIRFLEVYPVRSGQSVHCIFGRMTPEYRQQIKQESGTDDLPPENSLGLFTAMLEPIPGSFGDPGESIELAVDRHQSIYKRLLLARMLRIMLNQEVSQLDISVSIENVRGRGPTVLAQTSRSRSADQLTLPRLQGEGVAAITVGKEIQLQVKNGEDQDLYMSLLVIDAEGLVTVLFPYNWDAPEDQSLVSAYDEINFPRLVASPPLGLTELLVLASTRPLRQTLKTLQRLAPTDYRGTVDITEPDEVMSAILSDLDSRRSGGSGREVSQHDITQLAVVSLLYRVNGEME